MAELIQATVHCPRCGKLSATGDKFCAGSACRPSDSRLVKRYARRLSRNLENKNTKHVNSGSRA
jgi:hypothetical protein